MIKITWGNLRDRDFMQSLGKLYGQPMGYLEGMKFALIGREIKKQQKLCDQVHEGLLKKFGTPDPEKKGIYKLNEATIEDYKKEMEQLDATGFEVKVAKFDPAKLSEIVKFSPQDLMLLEPLFTPFEVTGDAPPLKVVPGDNPVESPATH
jgi:hypothetical protein